MTRKPRFQSRITAGDISLLVDPNSVERLGFALVRRDYQEDHPKNCRVLISLEDGSKIEDVGCQESHQLLHIGLALRANRLFLANASQYYVDVPDPFRSTIFYLGDIYRMKKGGSK